MVGIYCRISGNKEEGKDTSIETQEERGKAFAKGLGMPYKLYYDIGVSGTNYEKRDDFPKFLKDIKDSVITDIYAINQSRIERNPEIWQLFQSTVLNANAKWYPNGIYFDLDNTMNRFIANIISLVNKLHADLTSDAVTIAFSKNAKLGKGHGMRPYGIYYDKEGYMQIEEEEIEHVKNMFKWSVEGMGVYSIATKLNDYEVPTRYDKLGSTPAGRKGKNEGKQNKKWWGSTVSGILKNEIYKGVYKFGEDITDLPHLAIMTPEEFEAVQDNFEKNKRTKVGKPTEHKYLLHGLLYCEDCGYKFFGKRRKASRENTYRCSGNEAPLHICNNSKGFNIGRVETFILKHLFETKELQNHLNSIEVDDDTLELLALELKQLHKKITSTEKMVTRSFNMIYESGDKELQGDTRIQDKYKTDKKKLKQLKEKLEEVQKKKQDYEIGSSIVRVNNTIDGFDLDMGFEAIQEAVKTIVERIDVEYIPLEKNGRFIFKIKYRGFDETAHFTATQQLDRFALLRHDRAINPSDYPENSKLHSSIKTVVANYMNFDWSHTQFNEFFDRYSSDKKMSVRVKREEIIHFE